MNKIGDINFKEIKRISPSQYYSMKNCVYKSLLAEAFDKKPLLPVSPNAYFGTVLHKMLELIAKGIIKSEDDFNTEFDNQVTILEDELRNRGYDFLVPLKIKLKNYGLKKIQLKKHLKSKSGEGTNANDIKFYSEKWFESKDKLIGGKIDLIVENKNDVEIIDFKTGAVTQDFLDDEGEIISDIKSEYKEQIKLYAYLYFENTNNFPTSLSLIDLTKQKFSVEFSQEECKTIYLDAKVLLDKTNQCIREDTFSANPSEINCKFCLYRPACVFYQKQLDTVLLFNDVSGEIKEVKKFQNGNVNLFLQNGQMNFTVKNFSSDKYNELNNSRNKKISIYNLRKETMEFIYSVSDTTMIYEHE